MRRSIQIVSAYAYLLAAAGLLTGFSDGWAAEGEKLPCNHFCRTWMGYEGNEAAAPPPAPDETVTAKPAEVPRDAEPPVDDPVPKSVGAKSPQIETEGEPIRAKQKRKAEPDTADASDRRSPTARAKASKLAKNRKPDVDALSDARSGSEASPRRSRAAAEDNVRRPSRDRDATSPDSTRMTARDVPLPPRVPHAGRPVRTGVAQAGPTKADETRANDGAGQAAAPTAPPKAVPSVVAPAPVAAQVDVPPPARATVATDASKPTPSSDTAAKGAVGDSAGAGSALLAGRNVAPSVDARQNTPAATPRSEDPQGAAPENAEASAKHSSGAVDVSSTSGSQSSSGRVATPAIGGDTKAAGAAPQAVVSPTASLATAEAATKAPPTAVVEAPAVSAERPVAAPQPPTEVRAVVALPNPDQAASSTAATPPAQANVGAAAPKVPTTVSAQGATVVGTAPGPSLPEDPVVGSAPAPDQQTAGAASQALASPPPVVGTSAGAPKDGSTTPPDVVAVDPLPAPSPLELRGAEAASDPGTQVSKLAPPASARPPGPVAASVVGTAAEPATHAAEVATQAALPPPSPAPTVNDASTPLAAPAADVRAAAGTADDGATKSARNDAAAQPVVASVGPGEPAVPSLPVPGPGQVPVRGGDAPRTAMIEPQAPVSQSSAPALPDAARATSPDRGAAAERPASSASGSSKPSVGNGYGTLGKIENLRPPSTETASILMAHPAGSVPLDGNPASLVKIAVGNVSTESDGTAIAYTITNPAASPVDLLFIRCNAVDRKGAVVGSAFDYVENIPAGQQVQRVVRMSSEVTASGQTFSCANDAATQ